MDLWEKEEFPYQELLHKKWPEDPAILRKHPRMPISERAKIFSPFSALRGYEERLSEEDAQLLLREEAADTEELFTFPPSPSQ